MKWMFKIKLNTNGSINKHKSILVVKGYAQVFVVVFFDTFVQVARLDTIMMLLTNSA